MRVMHKVSFPGGRDYEQYAAEFELVAEDVSSGVLDDLNLIEKMFAFDTLVAYQGILFQYLKGYIDKEQLDAQSKRLFGMLSPKLEKAVKEMLTTNGIDKGETKKRTTSRKKVSSADTDEKAK